MSEPQISTPSKQAKNSFKRGSFPKSRRRLTKQASIQSKGVSERTTVSDARIRPTLKTWARRFSPPKIGKSHAAHLIWFVDSQRNANLAPEYKDKLQSLRSNLCEATDTSMLNYKLINSQRSQSVIHSERGDISEIVPSPSPSRHPDSSVI